MAKDENGPILGQASVPSRPLVLRLTSVLTPDLLSSRQSKLRLDSTAWLDGLRGCAALCVVLTHLTTSTHEGIELCYGAQFKHSNGFNTSPIALPILRLPFTGGHFAVMLFFTISGYVVPRRLLQQLHNGRASREELLDGLQSAIIRRPVRLFMPVLLSTFATFVLWHLLDIQPAFPQRQNNIVLEAWSWLQESSAFLFFFRGEWLFTSYNIHSWTIPVEFRGSMLLFVWLMVTHTISTRGRVMFAFAMILHLTIGSAGAWYACFFSGMLLSELELTAMNGSGAISEWKWLKAWRHASSLRTVLLHCLLLISLYLATQPSADWTTKEETLGHCYGWQTLSWLIPSHYVDVDSQFRWFWLFWAAWSMVYAVREIGWLRRCFEARFPQYLGKHCFSLYLVHGPLMIMFSEKLFYLTGVKEAWTAEQKALFGWYQTRFLNQSWWPLNPQSALVYGLEASFLLCVAISLPLFLYVAEIGTRTMDEPSVRTSRWLWHKWRSI